MVSVLLYFVFSLSFRYLCAVEGTPITAVVDSTNPDSFTLLVVGQGITKPVKIIRNSEVSNGPPPGELIQGVRVLIATDATDDIPSNDSVQFYDFSKGSDYYRSIPLKPYYEQIFRTPYTFIYEFDGYKDTLTGHIITDYDINIIDTNNIGVALIYEDTIKRAIEEENPDYDASFMIPYIINLPTQRVLKAGNVNAPNLTGYGIYKYASGGDYIYVMTYDKLLIYRSTDMSKVREVYVPYMANDTTTCNTCFPWVYCTPGGEYVAIESDTNIAIYDSTGNLLHIYTPESANVWVHYPHKPYGFSRIYAIYSDCFKLYGPSSIGRDLGDPPFMAIVCPPDFSIKNYLEIPEMSLNLIENDSTYGIVVAATPPFKGDTIYLYYVRPVGEIAFSTYKVLPGIASNSRMKYPYGGVLIYPDYFFIRHPEHDSSYIYRIIKEE